MTKFKVGDKVRFIEDYMDYKKGDIVEVAGFWSEGINYIGKGNSTGCYFSRVELVKPKQTKNQRITALEETVQHMRAELDKAFEVEQDLLKRVSALEFVLAENSKLTTNIPKVVKSANQQRAEMIEKAKMFLVENGGDDYHFDIDEKNGTVFAYKVIISGVGRYSVKYGLSKCHPNDVFNTDIGKAISFGRAKKLDVREFEQAVQPTEQEVGQILTFPKGDSWHKRHNYRIDGPTVDCGNLTVVYNEVDQLDHRVGKKSYGPFTKGVIINDTNAKYEVES